MKMIATVLTLIVVGILCLLSVQGTGILDKTATCLDEMDYRDGTDAQVKDENASGRGHDDDYCIGLKDGGMVGFTFDKFTETTIEFWVKVRDNYNNIYCRISETGRDNEISLRIRPDGKYGCTVFIFNKDGGAEVLIKQKTFKDTHIRDSWRMVTFKITTRENAEVSDDGFNVYVKVGNEDVSVIAEDDSLLRFTTRKFDAVEFFVENQDRTTYLDEITVNVNDLGGTSVNVGIPESATPAVLAIGIVFFIAIFYFANSRVTGSKRKVSRK